MNAVGRRGEFGRHDWPVFPYERIGGRRQRKFEPDLHDATFVRAMFEHRTREFRTDDQDRLRRLRGRVRSPPLERLRSPRDQGNSPGDANRATNQPEASIHG